MTIMIDGPYLAVESQKALVKRIQALDETPDVIECLVDKVLYHAPEGVPHASTMGIHATDDDGVEQVYCIGCYHCEYGARTHEGNDRVDALVKELALDDPATYGLTGTTGRATV